MFNTKAEQDAFFLSQDYQIPSITCTSDRQNLKYVSSTSWTPTLFDLGDGNYAGAFLLGGRTPGELGKRFAWGETSPKDTYTWNNYKFGGPDTFTKYNDTDGKTQLDPEDDPATVLLGEGWRTMSWADLQKYFSPLSVNGVVTNICIVSRTGDLLILPLVPIGSSTLYSNDISKFRGKTIRGVLNVYDRNGSQSVYFIPIYTPPV